LVGGVNARCALWLLKTLAAWTDVAEAKAAAYALLGTLLGKSVPPYISLPALRVKQANLLSALDLVTKRPAPQQVKDACRGACQ
jgi:ribose transport system substrate-binding protein